MKALALALVAALVGGQAARAQSTMAPPGSVTGRVDVELDLPKEDVPYTGEMILLHVRTAIHGVVVLDDIRQPSLTNFSWQQLGRDKLIHLMVDGFDVPGFERDIAIFPQRPGRLIIDPFIRHVTLVTGDNRRAEADFLSKPVYVDVQRHEGVGQAGEWWLPASALTYQESWETEPSEIARGQVAHRTLTIEAAGVTADRLPPAPVMRAPGIIAFAGPVKRETLITAAGPVARAVYQWDIKPATESPANLPAIVIPWFDARERHMRSLTVPSHWVSYAGMSLGPHGKTPASWRGQLFAGGPVLAAAAGFTWALSVGFLVWPGGRPREAFRHLRRFRTLRQAARRSDAAAFKAVLLDCARADPRLWRAIAQDPVLAPRLAQLDASLYAPAAPRPVPPLMPLARDLRRAWRRDAAGEAQTSAPLPLDGAIETRGRTSNHWTIYDMPLC